MIKITKNFVETSSQWLSTAEMCHLRVWNCHLLVQSIYHISSIYHPYLYIFFGNLYFLLFVQQNMLLKHWYVHWKIIVNTQGNNYQTISPLKGRHQLKKTFLSGIARNTKTPPPLTPIRATWSSFFGRQKQRFARMTDFCFWWW